MNQIAVKSLLLISILLCCILLTSISNIDRFIVSIELTEEDISNKTKTNNPNLIEEEEEKQFLINYVWDDFVLNSVELKDFCSTEKITSIFIEIITPPPLD